LPEGCIPKAAECAFKLPLQRFVLDFSLEKKDDPFRDSGKWPIGYLGGK
jgi:hypothetical protein